MMVLAEKRVRGKLNIIQREEKTTEEDGKDRPASETGFPGNTAGVG